MARISGKSGILVLGANTRLGATNIAWNPIRDLPEASGMDSAGTKQYVDGMIGATFSLTAHADTVAAGIPPSVQTGGAIAFRIDIDGVPTRRYSGTCRMSACGVTIDMAGTVDYAVEATVEGAWIEA